MPLLDTRVSSPKESTCASHHLQRLWIQTDPATKKSEVEQQSSTLTGDFVIIRGLGAGCKNLPVGESRPFSCYTSTEHYYTTFINFFINQYRIRWKYLFFCLLACLSQSTCPLWTCGWVMLLHCCGIFKLRQTRMVSQRVASTAF